jgi:NAD(P)-dependent dehydrogenase (short-subunit alcohol dehydrogenase family)
MEKKTIFITGASTGLGKATAKLFVAKGWKVIATMRSPEKESEHNQHADVVLLPLDVTNTAQIHQTVQKALDLGPIDVVFNNAGYGLVGAVESHSEQQIRAQFDTNFFGTLEVIRAFIPYLGNNKKVFSSIQHPFAVWFLIPNRLYTMQANGHCRDSPKVCPTIWLNLESVLKM